MAIHQEMINKFLKKLIEESNTLDKLSVTIAEGVLNLTAEILAGLGTPINVRVALSIGSFTFNRHERFVEFQVNGPVLISLQGIEIRARLGINLTPDPAERSGPVRSGACPAISGNKEDKITVNFNRILVSTICCKKLGFY